MSSHIAMWRTTVREAGRQMTSRKIKVKRWKAKSSGRSCIKIGKIWRMHPQNGKTSLPTCWLPSWLPS